MARRLLVITLLILSLVFLHSHYTNRSVDIWMLKVGQGESVLIREPSGRKLLFDGGPDETVLSQLGSILAPWDRRLDLAILSHNHLDHIRGLIAVLQRYQVGEVWLSGSPSNDGDYRQFQTELAAQHIQPLIRWFDQSKCSDICPEPLSFGHLTLQVYYPLKNMTGIKVKDAHDADLVVRVSFGQESLFLTGDLNEGHEREMLKACRSPCSLAATILQIPHHGSATGLLPAFFEAVQAKVALIPVGLNNKFGHPRAETLDKIMAAHIPIYRTDLQGRIHIVLSRDSYQVSTE